MIMENKLKTSQQCESMIFSLLEHWGESLNNNKRIFYNVLGLKMRQIRLNNGWSQTYVAQLLGVTFQQIQKYEKGVNDVPMHRLFLFCELTKTGINEFLTYFANKLMSTNAIIKGETHEQTNASA